MKNRTLFLFLVGLFALGIEAKGKKNKVSAGGHQAGVVPGQVMAAQQPGGISVMSGVVAPMVSGQPMTDQQFLQEQLLGMQNTETAELKSKIMAIKAKNAENKRIIDQGLSELVSGSVILYKK